MIHNTRWVRCAIAALAGLGLGAMLVLTVSGRLQRAVAQALQPETETAAIRYVATTGADDSNPCTQASAPCATVQHAVDVAASGDSVYIAEGSYTGVGVREGVTQVVFISKSLVVRGSYAPTFSEWNTQTHLTTLDAQGLGRVLAIMGDITVTVDGLKVTGGVAPGGGGIDAKLANLTLFNNQIIGNRGLYRGGGVSSAGAQSFFAKDNFIASNTAGCLDFSCFVDAAGGGLYVGSVQSVTLRNNQIVGNRLRGEGGGIYIYGYSAFRHIAIEGNDISENWVDIYDSDRGGKYGGFGGGLLVQSYSITATISHNRIARNTDIGLGALWAVGNFILNDNDISSNYTNGAVIYNFESDDRIESISHNRFSGNVGLGLSCACDNTNLADNYFGLNEALGLALAGTNNVLSRNVFESNHLRGLVIGDSYRGGNNTTIISNTFFANSGGMKIANGTENKLVANQFISNTAPSGGAIYIYAGGWLTPTNTAIDRNVFMSNTATEDGGAVALYYADGISITNNTFEENTAVKHGGAIYTFVTRATLNGNTAIRNTATFTGGGAIYIYTDPDTVIQKGRDAQSVMTLTNNIIAQNSVGPTAVGSGIAIRRSKVMLLHNTIADNSGAQGIDVSGEATVWLTNTILVSNVVGLQVEANSAATATATLWGNALELSGTRITTGTANFFGNPSFANPALHNYHLGSGSAAMNRGLATSVNTDIDGDDRLNSQPSDLGADEFRSRIYVPYIFR